VSLQLSFKLTWGAELAENVTDLLILIISVLCCFNRPQESHAGISSYSLERKEGSKLGNCKDIAEFFESRERVVITVA